MFIFKNEKLTLCERVCFIHYQRNACRYDKESFEKSFNNLLSILTTLKVIKRHGLISIQLREERRLVGKGKSW